MHQTPGIVPGASRAREVLSEKVSVSTQNCNNSPPRSQIGAPCRGNPYQPLIRKMKNFLVLTFIAALSAVTAHADTKIIIKGSDTLGAKLVPQLSEAYKAT